MSVHKRKDVTKDGRAWVFQISYTTYDGKKRYTSKVVGRVRPFAGGNI